MEANIIRQCKNCQKTFEIQPRFIKSRIKQGIKISGEFCSSRCKGAFFRKRLTVQCANCNREFSRQSAATKQSKSGRQFCSQSCATTYNNTHKTHGTRRSKLESYLEERLRAEFPDLVLVCNNKDAIGSELDFYFPQLRLAIELNGIFHYEPIYGTDKLEQVQANDQQKSLRCAAAGIEFCTIDTSTVDHVTNIIKERYWTIVRDLVTPLLGRTSNTNARVS